MSADPQPPGDGPRTVRIGKYQILRHIASGGMGAVYRARDTLSGQDVALKVLSPEMAARPAMLERFRREARHAARLEHPNIVRILEFNEASGTVYLAMEFVEGVDLFEYIQRKGPLDPGEARRLILQAIHALQHAYNKNVVHRDIKPSNFLIATDPKGNPLVKLIDMGLAQDANLEDHRLTKAGTTVGTLDYIAPEQARDSRSADIRSDIYSLGSTWYYLLAGQPPFPKGGLAERLYRIMSEMPRDVREHNPRVSEATWAVLERMMAKDPDQRYQTPAALLDDVLALDESPGHSGTQAPRHSGTRATGPRQRQSAEPTRTGPRRKAPRTAVPRKAATGRHVGLWVALAGVGALLSVGVLVLALVLLVRSPTPTTDPTPPVAGPPDGQRPGGSGIVVPPPLPLPPGAHAPGSPDPGPVRPPPPEPKKPVRPRLYQPAVPIDVQALRQEIAAPFPEGIGPWPDPEGAAVVRVARLPGKAKGDPATYRSLADACRALPAGKNAIIEVHDNGPLFETGATIPAPGREVLIRPGKGYHPLLVWDVERTLRERAARAEKEKKPDRSPLALLTSPAGTLRLEGLDVAVRWPHAASGEAALLAVGGHLRVDRCTFSVAGPHPGGLALARLTGRGPDGKGSRCHFRRCYARGAELVAVEADSPGPHLLFEECLVVGGARPLFSLRGDEEGATVHAVGSTFICKDTLFRVRTSPEAARSPAFHWLGWDVLLSRSHPREGGTLLDAGDKGEIDRMAWRSVNCLYAGWATLLHADTDITDIDLWRRRWTHAGDGVATTPWPRRTPGEVSTLPARNYNTDETRVSFAATREEGPLGCDVADLPPARDNWQALTCEPFVPFPVDVLTDTTPPDIPTSPAGRFHGARLDLTRTDLGAYLRDVQKRLPFGPRVVLHLTGEGECPTSPVRIRGSDLVLYFEQPAADKDPLVLRASEQDEEGARGLIEVDGGDLEVIHGRFRLHGPREGKNARPSATQPMLTAGSKLPWLLHVEGGDLRLCHCQLVGPELPVSIFHGLVSVRGSGDPRPERARTATFHRCVFVTGGDGLSLTGPGLHAVVRQSLLAVGGLGIRLRPDAGSELTTVPGKVLSPPALNVQVSLEHTTLAARQALVALESSAPAEGAGAPPPAEPVVLKTRRCAFLNPFGVPGRRASSGLLRVSGAGLRQGHLVWQSEGDLFDRRLAYPASSEGATPPAGSGPAGVVPGWEALWGSANVRAAVNNPFLFRLVLRTPPWALERLAVPGEYGAELGPLGVKKKVKRP